MNFFLFIETINEIINNIFQRTDDVDIMEWTNHMD